MSKLISDDNKGVAMREAQFRSGVQTFTCWVKEAEAPYALNFVRFTSDPIYINTGKK
jgi:hypothetical protein